MKLIPLNGKYGRGKFTKVDDDDFEWLSTMSFYLRYDGYAETFLNGRCRTLHQILFPPIKPLHVDHINRDKLDNRRSNLRYVSHGENLRNTPPRKTESGVKGVYRRSGNWAKPWSARATFNRKFHHLGCFETQEQAAAAVVDFWDRVAHDPSSIVPPKPQVNRRTK